MTMTFQMKIEALTQMKLETLKTELRKHTAAQAAMYSRFITTQEKSVLAGVSEHAAQIVKLMAEIELIERAQARVAK